MLKNPELLFMDEPTIGLDPMGARELRQMIPELVHRGKTVLLTTHYMSEADELSDHIAIINNGEIIASGTPSVIKRQFSKVAIFEVILRQGEEGITDSLAVVPGIIRVISSADGPLQKLTIHTQPGADIRDAVIRIIGETSIESMVTRDPTLEEAYLSILK